MFLGLGVRSLSRFGYGFGAADAGGFGVLCLRFGVLTLGFGVFRGLI